MRILIGVPYASGSPSTECAALGAQPLVSAGSLWRPNATPTRPAGWQPILPSVWRQAPALDSAGFTAMRLGGYRWTAASYIDMVTTNGGDSAKPIPWAWYSAMDYCCETEIARDRGEVERRMRLTVDTYADLLALCEGWRLEGATDLPDPIPVLQGRLPLDYLWSARELAAAIDAHHACRCPDGGACDAQWHRAAAGLPDLVGVGSVCRRHLRGPDGLLALLDVLDRHLPRRVKLHLFGVKGDALGHLAPYRDRVASVDSMAWDSRARSELQQERKALMLTEGVDKRTANRRLPMTMRRRLAVMRDWYAKQRLRWLTAQRPAQMGLFGGGA